MNEVLVESQIYAGRISVDELTHVLDFNSCSVTAEDLCRCDRKAAQRLLAQFLTKVDRALSACQHTRFKWLVHGFGSSESTIGGSSHAAAGLSNLYLQEAGVYRNGPSSSVQIDPEQQERRETEKQAYATSSQEALGRLVTVAHRVIHLSREVFASTSFERNKIETFLTQCQLFYENLVSFILHFLPGRTFVNTFQGTPTRAIVLP